jgi:hypothetical protein
MPELHKLCFVAVVKHGVSCSVLSRVKIRFLMARRIQCLHGLSNAESYLNLYRSEIDDLNGGLGRHRGS